MNGRSRPAKAAPETADPVKIANNDSTESPDQTSMLDWALHYAANYRPVFPCNERPGDWAKSPRIPKHEGGQGFKDSTLNETKIRGWWTRWPRALIGSPVPPDLICIDIDPRSGATVAKLEAIVGELPYTQAVISGRGDGGIHLFFWRPVDPETRNWRPVTESRLNKIIPGVDIKTSTGYTILPPSLHPDTRCPYEWRGNGMNQLVDPLPAKLEALIIAPPPRPAGTQRPPTSGALQGIVRRVAREATTRNKLLYWGARRLVDSGYPEEAYDALADAAAKAGLPQREIDKTINSARKALT